MDVALDVLHKPRLTLKALDNSSPGFPTLGIGWSPLQNATLKELRSRIEPERLRVPAAQLFVQNLSQLFQSCEIYSIVGFPG